MTGAPITDLHSAPAPTLRDKIENAAQACEEIALACAWLSRGEEMDGDLSGVLLALSRLSRRNADDIDALIEQLP